jgi:tetratricopeptide (TPR) repeat protein
MQNWGTLKEVQEGGGVRKALIISVSEYATQLQPLSFCKNDGEHMYELLKSINYEIEDNHKLIGYVKYESLREAIIDFFTDIDNKAEDTLLFYYSGHGIPDVDGDIYLASSEIDPDAPYRKGFSFNELTKMIQRSVSIRIVTVLDCCYSGAAKLSKGHEEDAARLGTAAIDSKANVLEQGEGKYLLAASQAAQEAYALKEGENSIFTYYLLEGLRGNEKSVDTDGNITPYSLGNYVYRAILNLPARKRPKQKPITKVEASGNIILAHYPQLAKIKPDLEQDPNDLIQDAVESLKTADYNNTIEYSDKAIKINPRFALAYNVKGQALFNLKQYQEALACYEKALGLRPKYIEAMNNKGLVLTAIGNYSKAIECFNQSIDLNPNDASIWNYKGLSFHALEKYEEAIECFDRAISLNPSYTEALNNKASASNQLNKISPPDIRKHSTSKKPQRNYLNILIPAVAAAIIGVVIAVVVIFGSEGHFTTTNQLETSNRTSAVGVNQTAAKQEQPANNTEGIGNGTANPLANIPVIGELFGGNRTSAVGGDNTTNMQNNTLSNPLAKVPVIGPLLGGNRTSSG